MEIFWLIIITITQVTTQMIEVIPVNTDGGYAIFKRNERPIVDSFTKILHIVNLTEYNELIDLIDYNANNLQLESNDEHLILLQREMKSLKHSFRILIPQVYKNRRSKRGLINLLGKGMKFLAGTMDDEDAVEISNHLNNLDQNMNNAMNQLNKQVVINNNLIKNVDEIKQHLNKQQKELNNFLTNITNQTNKIISNYNKSKYVLQLYADITALNKQIDKLMDIILLSRLNVLAHDVLTEEEIEKYNITVEITPYIQNSVIFNGELLIFAICIPKFTKEKYFDAIVVPFPNNKYEMLDIENTEVIIQSNNVYNNKEDMLTKRNLKPHLNICIRNLFNNNKTCTFRFSNESVIERIFDDLIILKNVNITKIQQNCSDHEIIVKGNNVIKFVNCKLEIC